MTAAGFVTKTSSPILSKFAIFKKINLLRKILKMTKVTNISFISAPQRDLSHRSVRLFQIKCKMVYRNSFKFNLTANVFSGVILKENMLCISFIFIFIFKQVHRYNTLQLLVLSISKGRTAKIDLCDM